VDSFKSLLRQFQPITIVSKFYYATGSALRGSISERVVPRVLLGAYREDLLQCVSGWVEWYQSDLCQVGSFSDDGDCVRTARAGFRGSGC